MRSSPSGRSSCPDHAVDGAHPLPVGVISGGVAPNVIPGRGRGEVMFRTVGDLPALRASLKSLERWVTVEEVLEVPPVTMPSVPGFETASFPYTTDIPSSRAGARRCCSGPARSTSRTPTTST